ncbi:hypothetical protein N0V95_003374 [Ascochyta clinopodiicola]|nr:hypothetical protein N0V95_003374 [Ascochyta clinopodiicola]
MQTTEHPNVGLSYEDLLASATPFRGGDIAKASVPRCPPLCECSDCEHVYYSLRDQQFYRWSYRKNLKDVEAAAILTELTREITVSREFLQQLMREHGEKIVSRWRQRTKQKRAKFLRDVEPDLPENSDSLVEEALLTDNLRNVMGQADWRPSYRRRYLLPYLNINVLVKSPSILLGLLCTRTNNSPEEWAPFDNE